MAHGTIARTKGPAMSLTKAALRERLRAEAAQRTSEERRQGSQAICARLEQQPVWQNAGKVLAFMALEHEPDLTGLLHKYVGAGKTLALPRFDSAVGSYGAVRVTDPASQLVPGKYGVLEPNADCSLLPLNELDLALVPGIGFSLNGCRLGRGKGYFDRMLCEVRGWICGVAFDWQVTVEIPSEQHDIHVNSIVTPTRWHLVQP
jgi:5-formyltetrahydrofolate cyclo-ligase